MRKVFIVSTGRTGTQFFANFFAQHFDNVISVHEPFYSRHFRIFSNMYYADVVSKKVLKRIFKLTRSQLFSQNNTTQVYIESNNFLFGFSGLFNELFEDYRIIHIVRDPRDYIKSHLNHGVFQGKKLLAKKYLPYWFMNVNKRLSINRNLNEYETLAGRWVAVNRFIEDSCQNDKNYKL